MKTDVNLELCQKRCAGNRNSRLFILESMFYGLS